MIPAKENLTDLPPACLATIKKVYNSWGLNIKNYQPEAESREYCAATFGLNQLKVKHRLAKITPTKAGQFVTIWKRNKKGITVPLDASDNFDLLIISVESGDRQGQFVFTKKILIAQNIIAHKQAPGKRAMRVYPPWDVVTSKQARKTQQWQTACFLFLSNQNLTDVPLPHGLFGL